MFKGCFAVENDAVGRNRSLKVKDTRACFGPCLGQNGAPSALRMVGLIFFTVAGWWCRCIRAKDCISIVLRIFSARSASTFAVSRNSVGRWTRKSGQQYRGRWQHGYRRSPCSRCQGYAPGAPDDAPLPRHQIGPRTVPSIAPPCAIFFHRRTTVAAQTAHSVSAKRATYRASVSISRFTASPTATRPQVVTAFV